MIVAERICVVKYCDSSECPKCGEIRKMNKEGNFDTHPFCYEKAREIPEEIATPGQKSFPEWCPLRVEISLPVATNPPKFPDPKTCSGYVSKKESDENTPEGACLHSFFTSLCAENLKKGNCPDWPPLTKVYEKYKHLDIMLGDPGACGKTPIYAIAGELYRAIKQARGGE